MAARFLPQCPYLQREEGRGREPPGWHRCPNSAFRGALVLPGWTTGCVLRTSLSTCLVGRVKVRQEEADLTAQSSLQTPLARAEEGRDGDHSHLHFPPGEHKAK